MSSYPTVSTRPRGCGYGPNQGILYKYRQQVKLCVGTENVCGAVVANFPAHHQKTQRRKQQHQTQTHHEHQPQEVALEPTLCVFHDAKLHRGHSFAPTGGTLMSTVFTERGEMISQAMHSIGTAPSVYVAGLEGVYAFSDGAREWTSREAEVRPNRLTGEVEVPCTDVFWMASPLSISPVRISTSSQSEAVRNGKGQLGLVLVKEFQSVHDLGFSVLTNIEPREGILRLGGSVIDRGTNSMVWHMAPSSAVHWKVPGWQEGSSFPSVFHLPDTVHKTDIIVMVYPESATMQAASVDTSAPVSEWELNALLEVKTAAEATVMPQVIDFSSVFSDLSSLFVLQNPHGCCEAYSCKDFQETKHPRFCFSVEHEGNFPPPEDVFDALSLQVLRTVRPVLEEDNTFADLVHDVYCRAVHCSNSDSTWNILCRLLRRSCGCHEIPQEEESGQEEAEGGFSPLCFSPDPALVLLPLYANEFEVEEDSDENLSYFHSEASIGLLVVSLHLLCESTLIQEGLFHFAPVLAEALLLPLTSAVGWHSYCSYYQLRYATTGKNQPVVEARAPVPFPTEEMLSSCFSGCQSLVDGLPPTVFGILKASLSEKSSAAVPWPTLRNIPPAHPISFAFNLVDLYRRCSSAPLTAATPATSAIGRTRGSRGQSHDRVGTTGSLWWERIVSEVVQLDCPSSYLLEHLALGPRQPLVIAFQLAKENPDPLWNTEQLQLIGRLDTALLSNLNQQQTPGQDVLRKATESSTTKVSPTIGDSDGISLPSECFARWDDTRLETVQSMMNTAVPLRLPSRGDGSDVVHQALGQLVRRALALSVGRGALTYASQNFRVRDLIPIPPLNASGVSADFLTVTLDVNVLPPESLVWPHFHNGCAAGLRYLPYPTEGTGLITRHWVVYQTRDANTQQQVARAGLLLAVGVMGHLSPLNATDIFSLLAKPTMQGMARDPTTIALMLGLGSSFRGTHNETVFRCISVHVQSLTPTNEDLEVALEVQTAALVSLGLLCQGRCDSFLSSVLLSQISRVPTDEHCTHRDGYALGAGLALGLVLLGHGRQHGLATLEGELLTLISGGKRRQLPFSVADTADMDEFLSAKHESFLTKAIESSWLHSQSTSCTKVWEGEKYNPNVTAIPSVIALGLCFLQTEDGPMAEKLAPPKTLKLLEALSPNEALVRVMFASLVEWSSMTPTPTSLLRFVPPSLVELSRRCTAQPELIEVAENSYLLTVLGFCLAGGALALGLRFAGSMNIDAKETVLGELKAFAANKIGTLGVAATTLQARAGTFAPCINACVSALGLIMAGTGDTGCFSIFRKLYRRTSATYGSHMAVGQALGFLFLSGGNSTLGNSLSSIAALVMSTLPFWPTNAQDNHYYSQALRHLYASSVVPRLLKTVDVETNDPVSLSVRLVLRSGRVGQDNRSENVGKMWTPMPTGTTEQAVAMTTPCLLPPPETIERIEVRSVDHYPLVLYNDQECGIVIGSQQLSIGVLKRHRRSLEEKACLDELRVHDLYCAVAYPPSPFSPSVALIQNYQRSALQRQLVLSDRLLLLTQSYRRFLGSPDSVAGDLAGRMDPDFVVGIDRSLEKVFWKLFTILPSPALNALLIGGVPISNALGQATEARLDPRWKTEAWVAVALHIFGLFDNHLLRSALQDHAHTLLDSTQRPFAVLTLCCGVKAKVLQQVADICLPLE